jgi:invasion protein IalB
LHFRRCDLQGCYVESGIDNNSIGALARATKAEMRIVSVDGKKFNLSFSLNGFSAAHDALVQMTRQKAAKPSAAPPAADTPPADAGNGN